MGNLLFAIIENYSINVMLYRNQGIALVIIQTLKPKSYLITVKSPVKESIFSLLVSQTVPPVSLLANEVHVYWWHNIV